MLLIDPSSVTAVAIATHVELLMVIDPGLALSDGLAVHRWSQLILTHKGALSGPGILTPG